MKNIILIFTVLFLAACAPGGGDANTGGSVPSSPNLNSPLIPPGGGSVSSPLSVTYYSVVHTVNGVPFTASCANYNSYAFCWDDGIKAVGANHYSYWQVTSPGGHCGGNCTSDPLAHTPTLVTTNLLNYMVNALFGTTPASLLSSGTPTTVACTLTGAIIDCGSFTIDLNQAAM
jgi:hypothetical protein